MLEFPEFFRIPLGEWTDVFMDWLLLKTGSFFDAVGYGVLQLLLYIEKFFLWLPWPVLVLGVALTAWRLMGWVYGLIMACMLLLIGSFGYWDFAMMTLALVTGAVLISLVIGIRWASP